MGSRKLELNPGWNAGGGDISGDSLASSGPESSKSAFNDLFKTIIIQTQQTSALD